MTKIDMIKQRLTELKNKARLLTNKEDVSIEELQEINNQIRVESEKLQTEELLIENLADKKGKEQNLATNDEKKYKTAFFNALRNKATTEDYNILSAKNALSSITGEDGGYLIPKDQQTEIYELKKKMFAFRNYVKIEPVTTSTGSRILEKNADEVPFVELTEGEEIEEVETPKFTEISYKVKDFAGILPVPNNLLKDSNSNIESYLNRWMAKKSNATENQAVLAIIDGITTKTTVKDLDSIKDMVNSELDSAFKDTAKIFMNEDAFNYFAKLKDAVGRPLLERDPKNPTQRIIEGLQVVEVPKRILKTVENKSKIIVGDLAEFITLFDREAYSILATNIGGDAFTKNRTNIRAIQRFDVKKFDDRAVIIGELNLATTVTE